MRRLRQAGGSEVNMIKKKNASREFENAVKQGYKIFPPKYVTDQLRELCRRLGEGYHLARYGCWNVAHCILDDGWSVTVRPLVTGKEVYVIELWRDYFREQVYRIDAVDDIDEIERDVSLLARKFIDGEDGIDI